MNILTKISVVVLLVVILASCVVFISMATVLPNYKLLYEGEKTRNDGFSQSARTAELVAARLRSDLELAQSRAQGISDSSEKEVARLKIDLEKVNGEKADLANRLMSMDTTLKDVQKTQASQNERNDALAKELDTARTAKNDVDKDLRQTLDKLNQGNLELERREKQMEFMKEEIARLEEQIRTMQTQMAKGGPAGTPGNAPGATASKEPAPKVNGTVTAVKNEIVSINVGSSKGVKQGTLMMIYRDGAYVAQLQIQEVDDGASAGIITKKKLDPMQGDKVQSIDDVR